MKKLIYVAAVAAVVMGITACGAGSQAGKENGGTVTETTKAVTVNLEDVHKAVKDVYGENYIPNMTYDAQTLETVFGLPDTLYEEVIAEGPMISVNVDTFIALKAKAGKAEDAEKALAAYRKIQAEDSVQYPMNQSKVEASQVIRHGDYVFFVMLGTASEEAVNQGEDAALKSAKEENQKAADVINGFFK